MAEDPLVAKAFDKTKHDELAELVSKLSPDEAQFFVDKLERALRKRRLQLIGYLVAMLVWALGMLVAFGVYLTADKGTFIAWVFLAPFGVVGVILWGFGRWSERVGGKDKPKKR